MTRVLVIGGKGMLGHKLVQQLSDRFEIYSTLRTSLDTADNYHLFQRDRTIEGVNVNSDADLARAFDKSRPEVVINAVGIVKQVPSSSDVVTTLKVNSILPHRLYQMSAEYGFRLILISTDCVFAGDKGDYSEEDKADALDIYGSSKRLGEIVGNRCLTIRTSIIGRELSTNHSLVEWFLGNRGGRVNGFTRAIYSGFPTIVFADIIADLLVNHPDLEGLYHVSSDPIDKFRLLSLINEAYKAGIEIEPDDRFVIDRSLNSSKFRTATGFVPPDWETMVDRMRSDRTPYHRWRK
jgi:dTDP-4-dehydrorhamnose reductase